MNVLLLSKDTNVVKAVSDYTEDNGHHLVTISGTDRAKHELESYSYDAVLLDCSIRSSELIGLSAEAYDALADTVVLLIGPLDMDQRERLGRRLSAHYSIDKTAPGQSVHRNDAACNDALHNRA